MSRKYSRLLSISTTSRLVNMLLTTTSTTLLAEWVGPYNGVPAFDEMDLADLKPALESAMATNLAA